MKSFFTSSDSLEDAGFEFLDHPADVWVHAWGPTLEASLEQCLYALMETMMNTKLIQAKQEFPIDITDETKGSLLIAFLSEFLFLFDTEWVIIKSIKLSPIEKLPSGHLRLRGTAYGEIFDPNKHEPDTEVKAITYSYLEINEKPSRTDIKIVYDI
ncbi:MAG: archease [Promethearchaeia archaeon]|nr:MAG: archease [Candidatus Lokiarchaeia archaeon]